MIAIAVIAFLIIVGCVVFFWRHCLRMRGKLDNERLQPIVAFDRLKRLQEGIDVHIINLKGIRVMLELLHSSCQSYNSDKIAEKLTELNELIDSAELLQQAPSENGGRLFTEDKIRSHFSLLLQASRWYRK